MEHSSVGLLTAILFFFFIDYFYCGEVTCGDSLLSDSVGSLKEPKALWSFDLYSYVISFECTT